MVRLSLSLLATAFAAVASAAPLFAQQSFKKITFDPQCLPGTSIKEYQSFELLSHELDTYVSRKIDGSRLVGGIDGDKNLQKLEFCIVSSDRHHCDSIWGTACILENVDYRIRVKGHDKAYLRVDGHYVDIVSSFEDASPLSLSNDNELGVRIAHKYKDGDKNVFATSSAFEEGKPIVLEYSQKNRKRQRFEIIESRKAMKIVDNIKCIPQIHIKEYEAFELYSYSLDSFVSKKFNQHVLVGGIFGNKLLQQLQFCIVSTDTECNPAYPTNCIYENTQYRYRVHGPEKGYLRVQDGLILIVPDFEDGTLLSMLWDENRGIRIAKQNKRSVSVLATTSPGAPLTLEGENKPTDSQFFALAAIKEPFDNLETATSPGDCLDTPLKEGERFLIEDRVFKGFVSKLRENNLLRAGVEGNPEFDLLQFSVVRLHREDMTQGPGSCIYQDAMYVFQVYGHGRLLGHLRVEKGFLEIVPELEMFTPLYFHQSSSGGLRIGQHTPDGPRVVTSFEPGMPLTFDVPKSGVDRQVFDLIPILRDINKKNEPRKCLDTPLKEGERFLIEDRVFEGFVSKLRENNLLRAGVEGNPEFDLLQFSVVRLHREDMTQGPGSCIYQDAMYVFQVYGHGRLLGHLRVEKGFLEIVPELEMFTPLYFHQSSSGGLRIGQHTPDGPRVVSTFKPGMPLTFEAPKSGVDRQVFNLVPILRDINKNEPRKCLDTPLKEGERFLIEDRVFKGFVSKLRGNNLLRAGVEGNPEFDLLQFSVDREDMTQGPGDCIYQDAMYVFRVYGHGRLLGYLRVEKGFLEIVQDFEMFTPLYFHQSISGGLRIGQHTPDGPQVVTAFEPGMPLTFEAPKSGVDRQVFDLVPILRDINKKNEPRKCLPDNYVREFQPFLVKNHAFNGFLSMSKRSPFVVAGEKNNQYLEPLKFVVGSYDEDDLKAPGDCIQEDFEYKFQVIEPMNGFLHLLGDQIVIVEHEEEATPLYFHKSASQGVRIARKTPNGPLAVATMYPGDPTTMEKPESKNERQVFDLLATVPSYEKHALW